MLAPELQKAIEGLKPGDLTPVIRTTRGYQVIKVETLDPGTLKSYEDARNDIADRISSEKRRGEYTKFLERLRGQAIIDWKNDEIKKAYDIGLQQLATRATGLP